MVRRSPPAPRTAASRPQAKASAKPEAAGHGSALKPLNLALQGGGAHGAYTWGVLDALLADGRLTLEALSATSAGSLNAVALADGWRRGGVDGARESLQRLWQAIAEAGRFNLLRPPWLDVFMHGMQQAVPLEWSPPYLWMSGLMQMMSPYQLNPLNINPLREVLEQQIDFEALRASPALKLFVSATNVETGKIKVFERQQLSVDVVLASACLPTLFQAVEIDGEHFWDGGYMGNPAIFPLIYECDSADVLIVHVNPVLRRGVPRTAAEIANRVNEISFNSSLMREMRAIAFVTSLIDRGKLSPDDARRMRIHSIRSDALMAAQGVASKMDTAWPYLCELRDAGRRQALAWLGEHFDQIGIDSTVDIRGEFL
ncbi:patatin-like phospholipase family protein [Paucibacter sp. APW11]|uniref:Patatin-like phospholipase family protein n=1 Tax=Roseateles aquae TaxID=3077235 RepID=A0ABU3PHB8_9BURK|nr:patatin-like phospholipase family protein [Paucibacter sp. APW11]MDT9001844.1 patatin-like phospholipase family protein [Paucibacter sp. APW11]